MAHVITKLCTKAASCVEECPVDAIHEGETQYYINPDDCIDCGACIAVCPIEAIFAEDELPEEHKGSIEENAKHYE